MPRYWALFLTVGTVLVGFIAYLHSGEVVHTLLAVAVFAVISTVIWKPPQGNSGKG